MPHPDLAVVIGAFSYTGRYVARRLLDQGRPRRDSYAQPGYRGSLPVSLPNSQRGGAPLRVIGYESKRFD